jgi:hypothetical protein
MKNGTAWILISWCAVLIATAVVISCGECPEEEVTSGAVYPLEVDTLQLVVTDTIGLEMGDSSYVFGMLMQVAHGSGGDIIALDMQKSCLSLSASNGEFKGNIGAPGPGPGEFQIPIDFAVFSDGSVAVSDAISRSISFFDPDGNYIRMMTGFFPTPPMSIEGGPDGSIIGEHMPMIIMGEEIEASLELSRWTDSTEADITYFSKPMELDFSGGSQAGIERGPEFDFAVGPGGEVLVAELSDTLFAVTGFSPDGEEFLNLSEEMDRTPMTQEEIDAGGLGLSIMITDGNASAGMDRMDTTYPWRNIIGSIGVDSEERIWVELAYTDKPMFRIYDYSGELLFVAAVDNGFTPVTRPVFKVDAGGILAWDRDPMDYPKIYLIQLTE